MGYTTSYLGPEMDESFGKGNNLQTSSNGWIKLASSVGHEIDLNTLHNPGNYTIEYWINGPEFPSSLSSLKLLNVLIVLVNDTEYQFVNIYDTIYMRMYDVKSSTFSPWKIRENTEGSVTISPTQPSSTIDGQSLWLDTSNPECPIFYLYINKTWTFISDAMMSSIYDTKNRKIDIFDYIDEQVVSKIPDIDCNVHIMNSEIHATKEEVDEWKQKPTQEDLGPISEEIKNELADEISAEVSAQKDSRLEALNNAIQELETVNTDSFSSHVEDGSLHPQKEDIDRWNNKADGDHTHIGDDSVKITFEDININEDTKVDVDKLPYDVKERAYSMPDEDSLFSISKNPYHNGDMFYIENDNNITWYFLVNDALLGTDDKSKAFKKFTIAAGKQGSWINVRNHPNSIDGYGITDIVKKDDLVLTNKKIDVICNTGSEATVIMVAKTETSYVSCVKLLKDIDGVTRIISSSADQLEAFLK